MWPAYRSGDVGQHASGQAVSAVLLVLLLVLLVVMVRLRGSDLESLHALA